MSQRTPAEIAAAHAAAPLCRAICLLALSAFARTVRCVLDPPASPYIHGRTQPSDWGRGWGPAVRIEVRDGVVLQSPASGSVRQAVVDHDGGGTLHYSVCVIEKAQWAGSLSSAIGWLR